MHVERSGLKLRQRPMRRSPAIYMLTVPEGPSTQHLRTLVPNTMSLMMAFGTRVLKHWALGPSGSGFHTKPRPTIRSWRPSEPRCVPTGEHKRSQDSPRRSNNFLDPQCTSIKGLMVSIRWYLGFLKGQLGGAGSVAYITWGSFSKHTPHRLLMLLIWFQRPYLVWTLGPDLLNREYLDPLGSSEPIIDHKLDRADAAVIGRSEVYCRTKTPPQQRS